MPTRTARGLVGTGCVALACVVIGVPRAAFPAPSIRVDVDSFWYESTAPPFPTAENQPDVLAGASERVLAAVGELLADFPDDFPQPPPRGVVIRAQPREELTRLIGFYTDTTSYGGAKLEGSTVFIDVNRSVFVGWQALNDAELRCFLGHELIHAYQFATGPDTGNGPELWRREIAAYAWEAAHLEPAVRSW